MFNFGSINNYSITTLTNTREIRFIIKIINSNNFQTLRY